MKPSFRSAAAMLVCAAVAVALGAALWPTVLGPSVEPGPGALLIARPGGTDAVFDKTVVLILEHGPEHTAGIILNRPAPTDGHRFGGPVPGGRIALWRDFEDGDVRWGLLSPGEAAPEGALLFDGLSRWAPGQLEEELTGGSWRVGRLPAGDLFGDPETLWWSASLAAH